MNNFLEWVKMLFPVAIAGIGWYVSSVIGPIESRLHKMEGEMPSLIEHKITANGVFQERIRQVAECKAKMDAIDERLRQLEKWDNQHEVHHAEERATYKRVLGDAK
jgi:hypothetical protein